MAHDYIPRRDTAFLHWSRAFSQYINAAPEALGLTPLQASQYAALHDAYAAAFAAAADRATPKIMAKKTARKAAQDQARRLVRIIQATPSVTDTQRREMRLTVRNTQPAPIPRPAEPPRLFATLRFGSTVRIRVRALDSTRRGKPRGVAGAMVLSYIGDTPPSDMTLWKSTPTTRPTSDLTFGNVVPGARLWLAACWYNPRAERGPACEPICLYLQCSTMLVSGEAILFQPQLQIAA